MTQEEKAEAYSKAVEKAKQEYSITTSEDRKQWLEELFPELMESEDERIRKEILDYIDKATGCKRWVAWIEKQGKPVEINPTEFDLQLNRLLVQFETLTKEELASSLSFYLNVVKNGYLSDNVEPTDYNSIDPHFGKPIDKVEPKFKVGDWCIDNEDGIVFQIVKVLDNTYRYRTNEGKEYSCARYSLELDARPWTISDVKEGDMLYDGNAACIFRKTMEDDDDIWIDTYCGINIDNEFKVNDEDECWCLSENCSPATKEQCDTLMKAMADAGYVFDFEKKELKEIENEEYDGEDYGIDSLWHAKNILEKTLGEVEGYQTDDGILDHKCAISFIDKLYKQKPAEWSEEDESNFQGIIDELKANKHHVTTDYEHQIYYKLLSWFKSLKERYVWKPSDEQIDALEHFVRSIGESGFASPYDDNTRLLYSLLEQLKKL